MSDSGSLSRWWVAVEATAIRSADEATAVDLPGLPAAVKTLSEVAVAEVRFDFSGAQALLDGIGDHSVSYRRPYDLESLEDRNSRLDQGPEGATEA